MRPIVSLFPKVTVTVRTDGAIRGSCRACGTVAVIVDAECSAGFKKRHERCVEAE